MEPDTDNNCRQAKDIVRRDIKQKSCELSFMPVRHAFIGESGESCECSTESSSHQQSPPVVFVIGCPGEDITHGNATQNVHQERAVGETVMMGKLRREMRYQKAGDCAEHSACRNTQDAYEHNDLLGRSHQPVVGG